MTVYAGLKALHLLCAVLWVGGLFYAYVVLRPSLAAIDPPQRMLLHTQVFRKFFLVIWHAMPLIIITGFAMLGLLGGMANAAWQVHAMLGLGLVMAAVFLATFFGPYRRFRRTTDRTRMAGNLDSIRKLIGVNLILGLITVVIAGLL
ncbi:CopD family protein [Rhodopila sp.]|uniref:CopD family protein n=1 Tax=Rhodopila sp. TaxID=2480087 RepID=UPI003D12FE53